MILISIVVVVAAAGAVIGVGLYIKSKTPVKQAAKAAAVTPFPDLSKDYGACAVVTKTQITSALGTIAAKVQDPVNVGVVGVVLIGTTLSNFSADAQSCQYHFVAYDKAATYINDNGLTVQVTKFGNSDSSAAFMKQIQLDKTSIAVSNVGDSAIYTYSPTGYPTETHYTLQVFKGNTLYEYTLHLPAKTTLDRPTAQTDLTALAKS